MYTYYHLSFSVSLKYTHTSACQSKQQSVSLLPRRLCACLCASLHFTPVEVFVDLYIRPLEQQNIPKESTRWRVTHTHAHTHTLKHTDMQMYTCKRFTPRNMPHVWTWSKSCTLQNKETRQNSLGSRQSKIKKLWSHMHTSHIYNNRREERRGEGG